MSDDTLHKYKKYKAKYLDLQSQLRQSGGGGVYTIPEFIKKNSLAKIQKDLINFVVANTQYCDTILGKGMMGQVYSPSVNNKMPVKTGKTTVFLNAAVKMTNDPGTIDTCYINKHLYIYAYKGITVEAIILSYINELWHKKLSPHLPFMIGYSNCNKDEKQKYINKIITEKHGLDYVVEYDDKKYLNEDGVFHPKWENSNRLGTLGHLLDYIVSRQKDLSVELPNKIKCNIVELIDSFCISFLHTQNLLRKNNIILSDMHPWNIFIHWLSKSCSYMGDTDISEAKYIYYKHKKKFIKIRTFGLLFKIGDVGSSTLDMPSKKLHIMGQFLDAKNNITKFNKSNGQNLLNWYHLSMYKERLPSSIYEKTVLSDIFAKKPYDTICSMSLQSYKNIDSMMSTEEMLDHYDKYMVSGIDEDADQVIVLS